MPEQKVLLLTPPFTQLNTPYPATAYLKGFLNTKGIVSNQADLGIEVILKLFSSDGLRKMFAYLETLDLELTENSYRVYALQHEYLRTIDPVVRFLQNKNPTLAHSICDRTYLPEASRFAQLEDLEWAFGTMGIQDRARHLATLYLEDLGDLIKEAVDPHFGFSRYAERLGRTATHFDELLTALQTDHSVITDFLNLLLKQKIEQTQPTVVCLSVPFPGNLFGALKCGQYIKQHHSNIKVVLGGGYANTELRSLSDTRVFDYIDYVCLDDGEAPVQFLLEHLSGNRAAKDLKRTYLRENDKVVYYNGAKEKDVAQRDTGAPDYSDFVLDDYLS
ncbi:MAG TPA: radical SAM protein, partial [Chitinophagales bacterium]|nr:radical SAM protein [Chitinophagales bacterium]